MTLFELIITSCKPFETSALSIFTLLSFALLMFTALALSIAWQYTLSMPCMNSRFTAIFNLLGDAPGVLAALQHNVLDRGGSQRQD